MSYSAQSAITKYHTSTLLNNRNLFSNKEKDELPLEQESLELMTWIRKKQKDNHVILQANFHDKLKFSTLPKLVSLRSWLFFLIREMDSCPQQMKVIRIFMSINIFYLKIIPIKSNNKYV